MSSAKRTELPRYNARAAGGRNHDMGRRQGNGREVINPAPQTTTPGTPSDGDNISLFIPDTRETKKPVSFLHRGQLLYGNRISHKGWDTIQFRYDPDLQSLLSLVEEQNQDGWNWEERYACDMRVEGTFFEVKVPKKNEGPKKFGDVAKGLATPQAATNETTREEDCLSSDSSDQEEEKGEDAGRDAPNASTTQYRNIRFGGPGRNLEAVNETDQTLSTPPIAREHVKGEFTLNKKLAEAPIIGGSTMESGPEKTEDKVTRSRNVCDKSQDSERLSWAEAAAGANGRSWADAGAAGKSQYPQEDGYVQISAAEYAQIQADERFARETVAAEERAKE